MNRLLQLPRIHTREGLGDSEQHFYLLQPSKYQSLVDGRLNKEDRGWYGETLEQKVMEDKRIQLFGTDNKRNMSVVNVFANLLELHQEYEKQGGSLCSNRHRRIYVSFLKQQTFKWNVTRFLDETNLWPLGGKFNASMYEDLSLYLEDPRGFLDKMAQQSRTGGRLSPVAAPAPIINVESGAKYYAPGATDESKHFAAGSKSVHNARGAYEGATVNYVNDDSIVSAKKDGAVLSATSLSASTSTKKDSSVLAVLSTSVSTKKGAQELPDTRVARHSSTVSTTNKEDAQVTHPSSTIKQYINGVDPTELTKGELEATAEFSKRAGELKTSVKSLRWTTRVHWKLVTLLLSASK
jgi:hypothetical protein